MDILGTPTTKDWPKLSSMPDYAAWIAERRTDTYVFMYLTCSIVSSLHQWYVDRAFTSHGFDLFAKILAYDPERRLTASEALKHPWFHEEPLPLKVCVYPALTKSIFPSKSPYPPGRMVQPDTHSSVAAASRSRKPRV